MEFKREFYKNYFDGGDVSKNQKSEFIKDILSLTNGDASTAWDTAYLIFGVGDETGIDGQRKLYDVVDKLPDRSSIHQMVNGICDPQLEYIETDIILIDNKRVFVITIPPSPYLYETTKKLSTTSQIFSQHVVFIRRGSSIGIANAKERSAILELKQVRYLETRKAPPVKFGMGVGALTGAMIGSSLRKDETTNNHNTINAAIASAVVGGFFGGLLGGIYQQVLRIKLMLYGVPKQWRGWALSGVIGWTVAFMLMARKLQQKISAMVSTYRRHRNT